MNCKKPATVYAIATIPSAITSIAVGRVREMRGRMYSPNPDARDRDDHHV